MSRKSDFSVLLGIILISIIGTTNMFAEDSTAQSILNKIISEEPVIKNGKVILPDAGDKNYEVIIAGSSNESVITSQGIIHTPLETMEVRLLYKVVNKADKTDTAMLHDKDVVVEIAGKYKQEAGNNARPDVVPGIREWKGGKGNFKLTGRSRIVVANASLSKTGEQIRYFFQKILNRPVELAVGTPRKDDLFFSISSQRNDLGKEGYGIEINDDGVKSEAGTMQGVLYAGMTLAQMLSLDEGNDELPKGFVRDYPAYEVRACMLDIARYYIPIDYLEEMLKYMAYFKVNQVQLHISDDGGERLANFRVESKKFPAVNSGLDPSEVYSQDAYRQMQKNVAAWGVDVVTEIDAPAHCRFVNLYNPSYMLDESHINLKNEEAIQFMQQLCNEFLDGEDPVFQSKIFHIGGDEYHRDEIYGEDFRKYLNKMIAYVNDKGFEPRMWASLGGGGMKGDTPVDTRVVSTYWAYSWADFPKMIEDGFRCINTSMDIYVVPGLDTYYDDHMDLEKAYDIWDTTILSGGFTILSEAHPLLVGCESALWYDRKVGISKFDYFDRLRNQIMLISEKGWYGRKKEHQTGKQFLTRINRLIDNVPGVNPSRNVPSRNKLVASYVFQEKKGTTVADDSSNGYIATVIDLEVEKGPGVLILDGKGHLQLPFNAIGYPYTVLVDLYIDPSTPQKAALFDGEEGTLYLNYDGKGNMGYDRKGYHFVFDYPIKTDIWQTIKLTCDSVGMNLYVNNVWVAKARYLEYKDVMPETSTFVLPTEAIGAGIIGKMDNLHIQNK